MKLILETTNGQILFYDIMIISLKDNVMRWYGHYTKGRHKGERIRTNGYDPFLVGYNSFKIDMTDVKSYDVKR